MSLFCRQAKLWWNFIELWALCGFIQFNGLLSFCWIFQKSEHTEIDWQWSIDCIVYCQIHVAVWPTMLQVTITIVNMIIMAPATYLTKWLMCLGSLIYTYICKFISVEVWYFKRFHQRLICRMDCRHRMQSRRIKHIGHNMLLSTLFMGRLILIICMKMSWVSLWTYWLFIKRNLLFLFIRKLQMLNRLGFFFFFHNSSSFLSSHNSWSQQSLKIRSSCKFKEYTKAIIFFNICQMLSWNTHVSMIGY